MRLNKFLDGQCAKVQLESGEKVFFSVLPNRIIVFKMLLVLPIAKLWDFTFPFCIRSSKEAWDSSKVILKAVLESAMQAKNIRELKDSLNSRAAAVLNAYIERHGREAGAPAVPPQDDSLKRTQTIIQSFSKVLERIGQQMLEKYPAAVYPASLLPYPKEEIREAFEAGARYTGDAKMRDSMKGCLVLLESFIDDDEANQRNSEMLKAFQNKSGESSPES